jgi:hypothetical protein
MKKAIVVASFVLPVLCQAQSPKDIEQCSQKADIFTSAAQARDTGEPPQDFYNFKVQSFNAMHDKDGLTIEFIKKAVNLVYFDPQFSQAGGQALYNQALEACLHPRGRYQPVQ